MDRVDFTQVLNWLLRMTIISVDEYNQLFTKALPYLY